MNIFLEILKTFFYDPFLNALVFIYQTIGFKDLAISILILTLLVKLLLLPLSKKAQESQKKMAIIKPRLDEIQKKYKEDPPRQYKEMMEVYKAEGISPYGGFGLIFLQLPILIGIYRVFSDIFNAEALNGLYPFIKAPSEISPMALGGLINLSQPVMFVVLLAAVFQYFQAKITMPKGQGGMMLFIGPLMTLFILPKLPSAVGLYWLLSTVLAIAEYYFFINKKDGKVGKLHQGNI